MKIGVLSDTHGFLDPKVLHYFQDCDEIWHAGDIGDITIVQQLQSFKPLRAVTGNIDGKELQKILPEDLRFECEGIHVWITHIGGKPPHYNPRIKKALMLDRPRLFVCGHSHICSIQRDPTQQQMLFINPGAAGNHGFHQVKTIVRFEIENAQFHNMEVIELGKRGTITT
jgi:putative phosphoesterase